MTTTRDDIAGLSERLRAKAEKAGRQWSYYPLVTEAATQLDALLKERDAMQARVKELEQRAPEAIAKENASLKTWIDLHRGDVMSLSNDVDHFRSEIEAAEARTDALQARVKELDLRYLGAVAARRILRDRAEKTEARALRAEQERDDAYEHAAKVAESNDRQLEWVNDRDAYSSPTRRMQNTIAAAIRRLTGKQD